MLVTKNPLWRMSKFSGKATVILTIASFKREGSGVGHFNEGIGSPKSKLFPLKIYSLIGNKKNYLVNYFMQHV